VCGELVSAFGSSEAFERAPSKAKRPVTALKFPERERPITRISCALAGTRFRVVTDVTALHLFIEYSGWANGDI
jgi:hypothetical protein